MSAELIAPWPRPRKCSECDEPLQLGKFAYEQRMCWMCFKQRAAEIIVLSETAEKAKIVMHMLSVMAEIYHEKI